MDERPKCGDDDLVFQQIMKHLSRWDFMANGLRTLHLVLGIIAVTSSLFVAAKVSLAVETFYVQCAAFLAALSVGLQTSLDLGGKVNRIRDAWRVLNTARLRYHADPNYTLAELTAAYGEAEQMVGDVREVLK